MDPDALGPQVSMTLVGLAGLGLYFLPGFVALARKLPDADDIFRINLLWGWTGIGWIVALARCLGSGTPRE